VVLARVVLASVGISRLLFKRRNILF